MRRRLAASLLAVLALLPTTWVAAAAWCGMEGEPCCCGDDRAPARGPAFAAPDECCCVAAPRDADEPLSAPPRDLPLAGWEWSPAMAEAGFVAAPVAMFAVVRHAAPSCAPRGPPGALYLRHHAFLC